ncbi:fatty acid synthase-like [Anoplophora glabripennis]|uniref:fatty acid synthase-like n=1 Tax=Anoplophora glabripennis TaxID=217634 RepID=UPI000C7719C9|nr:fatty acid synthase-like [Anoplophora glabripennis]
MDLLSDFYRDCDVDRFSLSFLEAHGTGTKAGDPQECDAIDSILVSGRKKPLLIGSLKSNMGHTEATVGLCSIIKCVLAMESGCIPPNIHFETPNNEIRGLVEGRMKVVVDKTPIEEENALMAVDSFGIGGANAHVLLRRNLKRKSISKDNLPRLVCVSRRTEEAITALVNQIDSNGMDAEYIKLLHEVFRKNIQNHLYRGYTIVSQCEGLSKTSAFCPEQGNNLYLAFGELDDWYEIGRQLMILPKFYDSILTQDNLTDKDISLSNVLLGKQMSDKDSIPVLGPVAVQIALVHLLNSINLECSGSFGSSVGDLYIKGYNPHVHKLYPRVDFPVSRGTPMISPYIRWNHSAEWFVPQFHLDHVKQTIQGIKHYRIDLADPQWAGHVIGGRVLFPATGYLYLVWETFAIAHGVSLKAFRVSLRNCKFFRATSMPTKGWVVFTVSILSSGEFEVVESNSTVVTGTINFLPKDEKKTWNFAFPDLTEFHGKKLSKMEVYKELHLRGYYYSGEFRMIEEYDFSASTAYVKWQVNWITFLDIVMQCKILQNDSRLLQVPIFISQVKIAADIHCDLIRETLEETAPLVPVYSDITTGEITCGGITISGIATSTIAGRKSLKRPLLETCEFVPNFTELDLHKSVRVNVQIVIENSLVRKFRTVELVDEYSNDKAELLTPIIKSAVRDEPLIQHSVKILSVNNLDVDVEVEDKELETESNAVLVIASKVIQRPEVMKSAFTAVKENGFIMSRESRCCNIKSDVYPDIIIVTMHKTPSETILLLRKKSTQRKTHACIEINSSENFPWLAKTQDAMSKNLEEDLILHSNNPTSGILGLVNSLRKESTSVDVRCVFVMNESEKFKPNCGQLKKNMAINVYQGGQWGTFRHLLLEGSNIVENEHCFVNVTSRGDLSSLSWIQGPLKHNAIPESEKELVHVYYSSINFKDVMIASGKINIDSISDRLEQGFPLGFDFSGKNRRGCHVMGISPKGCLSNLLVVDKSQIYCVPDTWTLEEAATVPVVYTTAIYALIMCGRMKKGQSILIHSGTGGVGQAAINLALHYGCKIFTTVGNSAKRDFIKTTYPELTDENIGNSHDETFEQMVHKGSNGRGVDMVLNSLAEDKLVASVRCLATGGRFLEIGKFDMLSNNHLSLLLFMKEATFQGVMLDQIYEEPTKCEIGKVFQKLIREGGVNPLKRKIFKCDEIEQAFGFMASGKHMGKVLVKVRESAEHLVGMPPKHSLRGIARYYCDPQKVYIIVGGLGGFGLELADWLVLRGARKLVLTSRKGMSNGYQHYRVRLWESYGVTIKISTAPVATREGCEQLLEESSRLGRICAIFNLALLLEDAIFENQTQKSFTATFEPKAIATRHLDDVTRTICPDLKDFVVFSSYVGGRGNAGQTNYAMANSVMERVCEKCKRDGYLALAIEWGAIGDVCVKI